MEHLNFPGKHCTANPLCHAHYYIETVPSIFVCRYCHTPLWQPRNLIDAHRFSHLIATRGLSAAYDTMLAHRPKAREALLVFTGLAKIHLTKAEVDDVLEKLELAISHEDASKPLMLGKKPFSYGKVKKKRGTGTGAKTKSPVYM